MRRHRCGARGAGFVLGAGVLLFAAAAGAGAAGDEKPAPNASPKGASSATSHDALVGVWKLNAELSEDPRAKLRQSSGGWSGGRGGDGEHGGGQGGRGEGRGPGAGGGGWGGGSHGGGGWGGHGGMGRGGAGAGPGGSPDAAAFVRPIAFEDRFTITNLEPEITMIDPDGAVRRLHADGKAYKDPSGLETKTRWEESGLVVETKTGRGRVKETWSVADAPRRLTVLVKMDRPYGGDVTVKRVFDATTVEDARRSEKE